MQCWLFFCCTAALTGYIVLRTQKLPAGGESGGWLDPEGSASLKGASILYVFIHHFGQLSWEWYNQHTFLGYLGVSMFLFIAGYVTRKQYERKGPSYLDRSFFAKKFVRIVIPYIVVTIVFGVLGRSSIREIAAKLMAFRSNWFLCAILLFYLFFYAAYLTKSSSRDRVLLFLFLAYILICIVRGTGYVWYNTSLCFYIGVKYSEQEEVLMNKFWEKGTGFRMLPLAALFLLFTGLGIAKIGAAFTSLVSSCCFVLLMIGIFSGRQLRDRLLIQVGNMSWEFYLVHTKVLYITQKYVGKNLFVWFAAALVSSLAAAKLISGGTAFVRDHWKRRRLSG